MNGYFARVASQTATRFWVNNVTLEEADLAIEAGSCGCTQNPTYSWKILNGSQDAAYAREVLRGILAEEPDDEVALMKLQRVLISNVARKFMPLYERSHGTQGFVSIQASPLREDVDTIVHWARINCAASPNLMAKIPATKEGLEAIRILVRERIPINATECMAVRQVLDVGEIYEDAIREMGNPAPMYFSLITGIYDEYLQKYVAENGVDIQPDTLWQAGMSVAKRVHALVRERKYSVGFIGGGARGLHHFTEMVGADASITINWIGSAKDLIDMNPPVVSRFFQPTPCSVEDELLEKLPDHRKAYFINGISPEEYEEYGPVALFRGNFVTAWRKALDYIAAERAK